MDPAWRADRISSDYCDRIPKRGSAIVCGIHWIWGPTSDYIWLGGAPEHGGKTTAILKMRLAPQSLLWSWGPKKRQDAIMRQDPPKQSATVRQEQPTKILWCQQSLKKRLAPAKSFKGQGLHATKAHQKLRWAFKTRIPSTWLHMNYSCILHWSVSLVGWMFYHSSFWKLYK